MGNPGWLTPWAIYQEDAGEYRLRKHDFKSDPTPDLLFPNLAGQVLVSKHAATPYLRIQEHFQSIQAAAATYIRSNQDLSAALPITFTLDKQPDVPRNLTWSFDSHAQITAFILVFTGIDAKGNAITDTFTQAAGWSGATAKAYATITSIQMTARTGTGAGDTMDIGIGSIVGLANNIDAAGDVYKDVKSASAGNAADYPAASYTVNTTNDTVDLSTGAAIVNGDKFTIYYKSNINTMS